jgi:WhiB family redox-sensing transcriptional regulator
MTASRNTWVKHAHLPLASPSDGPASLPFDGCCSAPWQERGLCVGEDPEIFFPSHGDTGEEARRICALCAVRMRCIEQAVEADEFGIWGGLDQHERRALRRRRGRRKAAVSSGRGRSDRLTR